jgi:hypothetical protein
MARIKDKEVVFLNDIYPTAKDPRTGESYNYQ